MPALIPLDQNDATPLPTKGSLFATTSSIIFDPPTSFITMSAATPVPSVSSTDFSGEVTSFSQKLFDLANTPVIIGLRKRQSSRADSQTNTGEEDSKEVGVDDSHQFFSFLKEHGISIAPSYEVDTLALQADGHISAARSTVGRLRAALMAEQTAAERRDDRVDIAALLQTCREQVETAELSTLAARAAEDKNVSRQVKYHALRLRQQASHQREENLDGIRTMLLAYGLGFTIASAIAAYSIYQSPSNSQG